MMPLPLCRILAVLVAGALTLAGPAPAFALRDMQITQSETGLEELQGNLQDAPLPALGRAQSTAGMEETIEQYAAYLRHLDPAGLINEIRRVLLTWDDALTAAYAEALSRGYSSTNLQELGLTKKWAEESAKELFEELVDDYDAANLGLALDQPQDPEGITWREHVRATWDQRRDPLLRTLLAFVWWAKHPDVPLDTWVMRVTALFLPDTPLAPSAPLRRGSRSGSSPGRAGMEEMAERAAAVVEERLGVVSVPGPAVANTQVQFYRAFGGLVTPDALEPVEAASVTLIRAGVVDSDPAVRRAIIEDMAAVPRVARVFYHPTVTPPSAAGVIATPLPIEAADARTQLAAAELTPRDVILLPDTIAAGLEDQWRPAAGARTPILVVPVAAALAADDLNPLAAIAAAMNGQILRVRPETILRTGLEDRDVFSVQY